MATVSVIVVPSADTTGLPLKVMSPAGPPKLTLAPGRNWLPRSVSLTVPASDVTIAGETAPSTGIATVNVKLLPTTPLTDTVTGPVTAWAGTVTVSELEEACVTIAATRTPPAPVNVTVAAPVKPDPPITTLLPVVPALCVQLTILSAV